MFPRRGPEKAGGAKQPLVNLKEKAAQFNADSEIQALLQQINLQDSTLDPLLSAPFSAQNADTLRAVTFDATALATQPLPYEKLDQLVFDLLLGVR